MEGVEIDVIFSLLFPYIFEEVELMLFAGDAADGFEAEKALFLIDVVLVMDGKCFLDLS